MRLSPLAGLAPLALAGCEVPEETGTPAAPPQASGTPISVEPDGGIGDGAGPPGAATALPIPARFHGVWDAGDCSASSELRVEVAPGLITYYESVGTVTNVDTASGGDALVSLAMEGEGQVWSDTVRLQIAATQGREALLLLPGPDSDVMLRPVPLLRCPG